MSKGTGMVDSWNNSIRVVDIPRLLYLHRFQMIDLYPVGQRCVPLFAYSGEDLRPAVRHPRTGVQIPSLRYLRTTAPMSDLLHLQDPVVSVVQLPSRKLSFIPPRL